LLARHGEAAEVHVRIHEAWHDGSAFQIYDAGSRSNQFSQTCITTRHDLAVRDGDVSRTGLGRIHGVDGCAGKQHVRLHGDQS
jgi:hypothetical protein